MKTWITADWHLGEDRFELMGRPFTSSIQHVDTLVNNHNTIVSPDDLVIVNGDVCYQKSPQHLDQVRRFNGKKILIRGNHDRVFTDEQLKPYFDEIYPEGSGFHTEISSGDTKIYLYVTHYPTCGNEGAFNLVGHIHAAWKYQLNMLNIGVDVHHFRPVDLDTIPFHINAITRFYDEDVWIGYNPINAEWRGKRGKAGSYFTPTKQ